MNPMESRIILGCMRIAALEATELRQLVETSLAEGKLLRSCGCLR